MNLLLNESALNYLCQLLVYSGSLISCRCCVNSLVNLKLELIKAVEIEQPATKSGQF